MSGDRPAGAESPGFTGYMAVQGVTDVEVGGSPIQADSVSVEIRAWFPEGGAGRTAPPKDPRDIKDVEVLIRAEGVPDDSPLRSWLKALQTHRTLVYLDLRRGDELLAVAKMYVTAVHPPEGRRRLVFSAWVVDERRHEVARQLGLRP